MVYENLPWMLYSLYPPQTEQASVFLLPSKFRILVVRLLVGPAGMPKCPRSKQMYLTLNALMPNPPMRPEAQSRTVNTMVKEPTVILSKEVHG